MIIIDKLLCVYLYAFQILIYREVGLIRIAYAVGEG